MTGRRAAGIWLSLLAQPGTLFYRKEPGPQSAVHVIRPNPHGVFVVPARPTVQADHRVLELPRAEPAWQPNHAHSLEGWMVVQAEILAPSGCNALAPDGLPLGVAVTVPEAAAYTLVRHAARCGFKQRHGGGVRELVEEVGGPTFT